MITLTGKKVSEGIAIGKLTFYKRDIKEIKRIYVKEIEKEVLRFQKAKEKAINELKQLYQTAVQEVGEANAAILRTSGRSRRRRSIRITCISLCPPA